MQHVEGLRRIRGRRWTALSGVAMVLAFPALLFAHLALVRGEPGEGSRLEEAPSEVLLTFTQAIEVPLSTIVLVGPEGEVPLGSLQTNEGRTILRAAITGPLTAGDFTVRWQAVGLDGHPVRGEYTFGIAPGAAGLPVDPPAVAAPKSLVPPPQTPTPTFDAQSPLYAGVRWLTYLGILGSTGAAGFLLLVIGAGRTARAGEGLPGNFRLAAASLGLLATLFTAVALALRLQAQSHALFGGGVTGERFSRLMSSAWGLGWSVQAGGAAVAAVGFLLARRAPAAGLALALLGAFGLSVSPGLSGHAASVERLTAAAVLADGLHVLGAGTWLGTLLALVLVGVPLVRRQPAEERSRILHRIVTAFSPVALGAAALVVATGAFASILHLQDVSDFWATAYGRVLSAKLFVVLLVAGAGAYNWRRLTPRSGDPGADARLRRSAGLELTAAALVVALTSVLVAVPPPAEAPVDANAAALSSAESGNP